MAIALLHKNIMPDDVLCKLLFRRRSLLQKARFAGDFLQREAKAEGAGGHFWHDEVLTQTP